MEKFSSDAEAAAIFDKNVGTLNPTKSLLKAYKSCRKSSTQKGKDKTISLLQMWIKSSKESNRGLEKIVDSDFSEMVFYSQQNIIRNILETQRRWRVSGRKLDDKYWNELRSISEIGSRTSKEFSIAMAAADSGLLKEKEESKIIKRQGSSFKRMKLIFQNVQ